MQNFINFSILLVALLANIHSICGNKTSSLHGTEHYNRIRMKRDFMEAAAGAAAMAAETIQQGAAFKDKGEGSIG